MEPDERHPSRARDREWGWGRGWRRGWGDWATVAGQEVRDLWLGGRGPVLLVVFSGLLSAVAYLNATSQTLNFLERRESVGLTLQVAVAVGSLMTMVVTADAISGARERGTLESLLLAPVGRRSILLGTLVGAQTLWLGAFLVTVPYLWTLGRGVSTVGPALLLGLTVGTLLAVGLSSLGLLVSVVTGSARASVSASLLVLLALFAPTQLPTGLPQGWFGGLLDRVNPVAAGLHYVGAVLVSGQRWSDGLSYLWSPALAAAVLGAVLIGWAPRRLRLAPGVRSR